MSEQPRHPKTLGRRDIVLFTVSAILLLDTLAAGASIGPSAIVWWVLLGLIFFVPYALICAELGTTYPEQGGIYAWVRHAFGRRWASRATWAYWVNTAVWIPANVILFTGIFAQLFAPGLGMPAQIALGIALLWLAVGVNVITLDVGKWVPNFGAIIKIVVITVVMFGAYSYVQEHGMANDLSPKNLMPSWDGSLEYISVIIYGMLGFELASAGSGEMKDPARDVPLAILFSGLIIIVLYTLATLAILAAIPAADIDLVEGLVDTLALLLGDGPTGRLLVAAFGIGALYTFFSNSVTWSLGCNRAMAEAAAEGEFPALFARQHARLGTPVGAAVLMGATGTLALLVYGFLAASNADLFWTLFAFSGAIFLLPYVMLVFAFARLRRSDATRPRPFRVPGGDAVGQLFAYVCAGLLLVAIAFFVYTPGSGVDEALLVGLAVVLLCGEALIQITERRTSD